MTDVTRGYYSPEVRAGGDSGQHAGDPLIEHRIGYSRRSGALHAVTKVVARPALRYFPLRGPVTRLIPLVELDRKSTRLNSSHANISYAVFCLKKKTRIDGVSCHSGRTVN